MRIGDMVTTNKAWREAHPRCKSRGVGEIVNITQAAFGCAVSVKWRSGKYDQMSDRYLLVLMSDDDAADATVNL